MNTGVELGHIFVQTQLKTFNGGLNPVNLLWVRQCSDT